LGALSAPEVMQGQIQMTFGVIDIIIAVVSVLLVPLLDAVFIAQVNDLKLRKSGSDLEQRLSA
jgi:uncharacterized membrane protein HdeD (DUF308 family)